MESNEQTELTSKTETSSEMTPNEGGSLGRGGIEQKGKRTQPGRSDSHMMLSNFANLATLPFQVSRGDHACFIRLCR